MTSWGPHAVTSRPPSPADARTESALRRYLGIAMFEALGERRARQDEPTSSAHDR